MKNKKIIVIVIIIIIILLVSIIIGYKTINKDKKNNQTSNNFCLPNKDTCNEEEVTTKLLNFIEENDLNLFDNFNNSIVDITDYSNQDKLFIAFLHLVKDENNKFYDYVSEKLFEDYIKKILGASSVLEHHNIKCPYDDIDFINYNKDKKAYSYNHNHPGHGLDTIDTYLNKAINLEVHDNNYILTVIKVFNAYDGSLFTNLKDGNMSTIYNYNDDFYTDANIKDKIKQVFDEKYNEIKDNIVEYKYTFIKEEDNYIFKKYEIIKN